jgi:hypothetical protein
MGHERDTRRALESERFASGVCPDGRQACDGAACEWRMDPMGLDRRPWCERWHREREEGGQHDAG